MFDDQPIQTPGQVPGNLPIGEPDDILAEFDQNVSVNSVNTLDSTVQPPVRETALDAGVLKPKISPVSETLTVSQPDSSNNSSETQFRVMPKIDEIPTINSDANVQEMYPTKDPVIAKVLMVVFLILLVIGLAFGSWWAYGKYSEKKDGTTQVNQPEVTNSVSEIDLSIPPEEVTVIGGSIANSSTLETNSNNPFNSESESNSSIGDGQMLFGEIVDTDGDGLEDAAEVKIGIDYKNWDSDGDSLSDGDEVNIWKTDPLKPDTDGDSYSDGVEVKNGYNPLGSGKLFEVTLSNTASSTNTNTVK